MVLSPKSLQADVTGEGPLVCMRSLMDHQIVGLERKRRRGREEEMDVSEVAVC